MAASPSKPFLNASLSSPTSAHASPVPTSPPPSVAPIRPLNITLKTFTALVAHRLNAPTVAVKVEPSLISSVDPIIKPEPASINLVMSSQQQSLPAPHKQSINDNIPAVASLRQEIERMSSAAVPALETRGVETSAAAGIQRPEANCSTVLISSRPSASNEGARSPAQGASSVAAETVPAATNIERIPADVPSVPGGQQPFVISPSITLSQAKQNMTISDPVGQTVPKPNPEEPTAGPGFVLPNAANGAPPTPPASRVPTGPRKGISPARLPESSADHLPPPVFGPNLPAAGKPTALGGHSQPRSVDSRRRVISGPAVNGPSTVNIVQPPSNRQQQQLDSSERQGTAPSILGSTHAHRTSIRPAEARTLPIRQGFERTNDRRGDERTPVVTHRPTHESPNLIPLGRPTPRPTAPSVTEPSGVGHPSAVDARFLPSAPSLAVGYRRDRSLERVMTNTSGGSGKYPSMVPQARVEAEAPDVSFDPPGPYDVRRRTQAGYDQERAGGGRSDPQLQKRVYGETLRQSTWREPKSPELTEYSSKRKREDDYAPTSPRFQRRREDDGIRRGGQVHSDRRSSYPERRRTPSPDRRSSYLEQHRSPSLDHTRHHSPPRRDSRNDDWDFGDDRPLRPQPYSFNSLTDGFWKEGRDYRSATIDTYRPTSPIPRPIPVSLHGPRYQAEPSNSRPRPDIYRLQSRVQSPPERTIAPNSTFEQSGRFGDVYRPEYPASPPIRPPSLSPPRRQPRYTDNEPGLKVIHYDHRSPAQSLRTKDAFYSPSPPHRIARRSRSPVRQTHHNNDVFPKLAHPGVFNRPVSPSRRSPYEAPQRVAQTRPLNPQNIYNPSDEAERGRRYRAPRSPTPVTPPISVTSARTPPREDMQMGWTAQQETIEYNRSADVRAIHPSQSRRSIPPTRAAPPIEPLSRSTMDSGRARILIDSRASPRTTPPSGPIELDQPNRLGLFPDTFEATATHVPSPHTPIIENKRVSEDIPVSLLQRVDGFNASQRVGSSGSSLAGRFTDAPKPLASRITSFERGGQRGRRGPGPGPGQTSLLTRISD
ncbi:hypothetical protein FRB94_013336 [Tulasnella sp. JGI-2019a]|nr:hypothetical protein FRB94_013336 [Tulasnella sp. JGI-2019a]